MMSFHYCNHHVPDKYCKHPECRPMKNLKNLNLERIIRLIKQPMEDELRDLLAKYKTIRAEQNALLGHSYDTQPTSYRVGQIAVLDQVIADLRELIANDTRSGV